MLNEASEFDGREMEGVKVGLRRVLERLVIASELIDDCVFGFDEALRARPSMLRDN